jgi:hypothetical protein
MADLRTSLRGWLLPAAGSDDAEVIEAPIEVPGWSQRPWVKLRPLTYEQELRRQALEWVEEYEAPRLPDGGFGQESGPVIRRRPDVWAMREFCFRHCLLDFLLPREGRDGTIVETRYVAGNWPANLAIIRELPPRLGEWLWSAVEDANRMRWEDREFLEHAKNA